MKSCLNMKSWATVSREDIFQWTPVWCGVWGPGRGGRGQGILEGAGGLNLPFPLRFTDDSCSFLSSSFLFVLFLLQNITLCCEKFSSFSRFPHLGNPASRLLFSRLTWSYRLLYFQITAPYLPPLSVTVTDDFVLCCLRTTDVFFNDTLTRNIILPEIQHSQFQKGL